MPRKEAKPAKKPRAKLWNRSFPDIAMRRGTRAIQAKNSRSNFGKERIRRTPERRLKKISLFFMKSILRNNRLFFKEDLNF
jgi:hypothetical protein